MPTTPTQTAKIPSDVHGRIQAFAKAKKTNGHVVIRAHEMAFDAATRRQQQRFIRKARAEYPARRGRGAFPVRVPDCPVNALAG